MSNKLLDKEIIRLGLQVPELAALRKDEYAYNIMLMQPSGALRASSEGIGNNDPAVAIGKHIAFLKLALNKNVDIAMSPEYSCPWAALIKAFENDVIPSQGRLWFVGCESVPLSEMEGMVSSIRSTGKGVEIHWILGAFEEDAAKTFLDPACYVYRTPPAEHREHLVVAVEFKKNASGHPLEHIERDHMIRGTTRYVLRNSDDSIYLTALICSDAMGFKWGEELQETVNMPYLILHPQLNKDPRHVEFKRYREFAYSHDWDEFEFMCVNWARGFTIPNDSPCGFGGSAYYTKSRALRLSDDRMDRNHANGLYYTRCEKLRSHIYFFNYDEHVFHFRTTKPSQKAVPAALHGRTGPEMLHVYSWQNEDQDWVPITRADDGFSGFCAEFGSTAEIAPLLDDDLKALDRERLLALSCGRVRFPKRGDWYDPSNIRFLNVGVDEVVHRMTFTHDPCMTAKEERFRLLRQYYKLKNEIISNEDLPRCIADLKQDCSLKYPVRPGEYNYNLCASGGGGESTVAYLGDCPLEDAQRAYDEMCRVVGDGRRRLVVWVNQGVGVRPIYEGNPLIIDDLEEDPTSISGEK